MKYGWLSIFFFSCAMAAAQPVFDSLRQVLASARTDTARIDAYLNLASRYRRVNLDSLQYYAHRADSLATPRNDTGRIAHARLLLAIGELRRGNMLRSLDLSNVALALAQKVGRRETIAEVLNNIGLVRNYQGDYPAALEYYQQAMVIAEELKNTGIIAGINNNIGGIHYNLKDYPHALNYWKLAMAQFLQVGDRAAAGASMNNIGQAYTNKGDYPQALYYYKKSLAMCDAGACNCYFPIENMGRNHLHLKQLDSAEYYLKESLRGGQKCNNVVIQFGSMQALADVYRAGGNMDLALQYLRRAFALGRRAKLSKETSEVAKTLSDVLDKMGRGQEAFTFFKVYHALSDSLYNNENAKAIGKLEAQHEFEMAEREQELLERLADAEKEKIYTRERWVRNVFAGAFLIMIGIAVALYRNYRHKMAANEKLEVLNHEIEAQKVSLENQTDELYRLNEQLNELNNALEARIAERTGELSRKNTELEVKNTLLADYAFINAHKLRAPVATLLGLVMLFDNPSVDEFERRDIVRRIRDCVEDLNNIAREIRMTLEQDTL